MHDAQAGSADERFRGREDGKVRAAPPEPLLLKSAVGCFVNPRFALHTSRARGRPSLTHVPHLYRGKILATSIRMIRVAEGCQRGSAGSASRRGRGATLTSGAVPARLASGSRCRQ